MESHDQPLTVGPWGRTLLQADGVGAGVRVVYPAGLGLAHAPLVPHLCVCVDAGVGGCACVCGRVCVCVCVVCGV